MYGSSISIKKNLNYIRVIFSFCLLLLGIYNYDFLIKNPLENLIYFSAIILSNIILIYLPQNFFKNIKFHYVIFLLDISFIIIGITLFTKVDIPFIISVFLAIFMAALSKSSGLSLFIAIIVNSIYVYLKSEGKLSYDIFNENFLLNLPFIFIVSLHSTYLAEKVDEEIKEKIQLEKINKFLFQKKKTIGNELSEFLNFVENLIDNLNEGIIFIDNNGIVRIFSKKCEQILEIKKSFVLEKPLNDSKLPEEIIKLILDLKFKETLIKKEKIIIKGENKEKVVYINMDFVKDESEGKIGIICEIYE